MLVSLGRLSGKPIASFSRSVNKPTRRLLRLVQIRQFLAQVLYLWLIVNDDVRLIRMMGQIVLVISLGFVEGLKRSNLGNNGPRKNFSPIQLIDVCLRNTPLLFVCVENRRAILSPSVGSLAI